MSGPPCPLCAPCREAHGFPTGASPPLAARVELLGRKGRITGLMRMMGKLAPEDRPMMGKRANEMRQLIEGMLD